MRLIIIPLIIIAFASSVQAQEVIEWNEKRKLTFADFKKASVKASPQHIISRYSIRTDLDSTSLLPSKTYNGQVTALFHPDDSWLDESNKSGLQYSNTIFDIYEWACRRFRKLLIENRDLVIAGKMQELSTELDKEFTTILEAYDSESQYGSNLLEQMKWESRISQELLALAAYCKTCGESKLN